MEGTGFIKDGQQPSARKPGLAGTYERNLDAKGRLSLPAAIRDELGGALYVFPAPDVDALYVFPRSEFDAWIDRLFEGEFHERVEDDSELRRYLYSVATPIEIDNASRIGLSEALRSEVGLEREVSIVGLRDHLEIWDRKKWQAKQAELKKNVMAKYFKRK